MKVPHSTFIRARWRVWLTGALERLRLQPGRFARELVGQTAEDGEIPRSMVANWLNGKAAVSAMAAYRAGDTLARLQLRHASGLLAVLAAGHFADFAKAVRVLGRSKEAQLLVSSVVRHMPVAAEADIARGGRWDAALSATQSELVRNAQETLADMSSSDAACTKLKDAWSNRNLTRLHYDNPELRKAGALVEIAVASAEIARKREMPPYLVWREVARNLDISWRYAAHLARGVDFSHHLLDRADEILLDLIELNERNLR